MVRAVRVVRVLRHVDKVLQAIRSPAKIRQILVRRAVIRVVRVLSKDIPLVRRVVGGSSVARWSVAVIVYAIRVVSIIRLVRVIRKAGVVNVRAGKVGSEGWLTCSSSSRGRLLCCLKMGMSRRNDSGQAFETCCVG